MVKHASNFDYCELVKGAIFKVISFNVKHFNYFRLEKEFDNILSYNREQDSNSQTSGLVDYYVIFIL